MAALSLLTLNLNVFNNGQPALSLSIPVGNSAAQVASQSAYAFATGDNTLTKPTGCQMLILSAISGTLKLYGSGNDSLGTVGFVALPVTGASIVINASAGAKANLNWA